VSAVSNDAIYRREGEVYLPGEWAGGPWSARHQHGGAAAALLARGALAAARETELRVARLTIDLFRPVPMQPLRLVRRFARQGRRIALAELSLLHEESEVTRASALLLRERGDLAPNWASHGEPAPPGPESCEQVEFMPRTFREQLPPGFHWSIQVRMARAAEAPLAWIHTPLEVVEGEPTSAFERAAALSDLCFGLGGRTLLRRGWQEAASMSTRFINVDTTLYFEREPEGEWFAMRPTRIADDRGVGVAEVVSYDACGRYGRALQAILANDFVGPPFKA
jgi:hypothetical protein